MAKLEAESNERELDLERRASGLARLEIELESKQLKFEANQEIERKRILEEKRKIQDQRQLIETERRNFQRIILEESEHMATAKATAFIHQNLAKPQPSQNPGMATSKRPQRTLDSLMGQHLSEDPLPNTGSDLSEMDLRGMINALEGERAKNQDQRSKIQEHKKMLKEEWKRIKDERKTILEAVKKLGEAEKRFAQKLNEIEDITQSCVELRQESRRCLEMAQQLGDQRSESKRALHHQLEQIQRKEAQLEETRRNLIQERKRLWNTRSSIFCSKCQHDLTNGLHEESQPEYSKSMRPRPNRTAADGQNSSASQLASWKQEAALDQMYLAQESQYLQSLQPT